MSEDVPTEVVLPDELVLFDGVCGFCDQAVQWLLKLDRQGRFRYAPLQGDAAAEVRSRHAEVPDSIDTVVFFERNDGRERVWLRSSAVLRICHKLGGAWTLVGVFWVIPRPLRDLAYELFARNRYRIWGKKDSCQLPEVEEMARFIP